MKLQDLIDQQAAQHQALGLPAYQAPADVPPLPSSEKTLLLPATLAGRCANGDERGAGRIVHAVQASPSEVQFGINAYARSLCGKTHGARSAGWSHDTTLAITCPKCLKLATQGNRS